MQATKTAVIDALHSFINKRPGLDPADYISGWNDTEGRRTYRSESASITKDLNHARTLLNSLAWRDSITAQDIIDAAKHAFSGRLTIKVNDQGQPSIGYCVGQYYPTEYRKAVAAVAASVLWDYWRSNTVIGDGAGERIRNTARKEFGRGLSSRYFN